MSFKSGQRRLQQRNQRAILQQAGLEKEYRRLQNRIKKEMNGAKPYLYRDIEPMSLGEFLYIIIVFSPEGDCLAQVVGLSVADAIKTMEDWLDE